MSGRLNWARVAGENKARYRPSPRARAASAAQLNYIEALKLRKGQRIPYTPKTMQGASDLIERLVALPDVEQREEEPLTSVENPYTPRKAIVAELRDTFPSLTPMTANSFIQLAEAAFDDLGIGLLLGEIIEMAEFAPEDSEQLVPWLLRRFLAFSAA